MEFIKYLWKLFLTKNSVNKNGFSFCPNKKVISKTGVFARVQTLQAA